MAVINVLRIYVNLLRNQLQIFLRDFRQIGRVAFQPFLRIPPQQYGVRPPRNIPRPIPVVLRQREHDLPRRFDILRLFRFRIRRRAGRRIADFQRLFPVPAKRLYRAAMRFQGVMRHFKCIPQGAFQSGCVDAGQVTQPDKALRLVQGKEVRDPVAEPLRRQLCKLRQPFGAFRVHPAAALVKRIRHIPVVQGDIRRNPVFQKRVDQLIVKLHARFVDLPRALRQQPRPGNRKTVCFQPHFLHQGDILPETVVVVARDISVMPAENMTRLVRVNIPHILPFAVLVKRPFNLISAGRSAPYKILCKHFMFLSYSASLWTASVSRFSFSAASASLLPRTPM